MDDKKNTRILLKVFMPAFLVTFPLVVFLYIYTFYKTHANEISFLEVLMVPSVVFIVLASVFIFFITIWWYRGPSGGIHK